MDYLQLATSAVELARRTGGYAAEAYVLDAKSLTIEVANQNVDMLKFAVDTGIGLRIISTNGSVGFAYSTNLDDMEDLAKRAINNGNNTFQDQYNVLPKCSDPIRSMNLIDEKIAQTSVEEKINMAKKLEQAARHADKHVKRTERCVYEDAEYGVALANSNGLATYYRSGYCGLYGVVLAEKDHDVQTGTGIKFSRHFDDLNADIVGQEAAKDAAMLLGAKRIGTVRAALVLPPQTATSFFSILIPSLGADSVQKGRSLFKDKLGRKVVSHLVTLIDDGRLPDGIATKPVDGEGVSTRRTHLIMEGNLNSYLYNTYTAAKDHVESTGNGVRGSFKGMPEVGPTNIFIQPGPLECDQLIKEVRDGFFVTNVMGMHTANPISGDFSVGAAGVWIKDGEFTHAVRGVAIAGNILDLFSEIDGVGDDLRFYGSQGSPTLRVNNITISGS